jgi:hypothetical protein
MRLFRQTIPQKWDTALAPMAQELGKILNGDQSVLQPKHWTGPPLRQNPFALDLDMTS